MVTATEIISQPHQASTNSHESPCIAIIFSYTYTSYTYIYIHIILADSSPWCPKLPLLTVRLAGAGGMRCVPRMLHWGGVVFSWREVIEGRSSSIYIYTYIDLFIYHILVRSIINIQKRYDYEEWMIPIHERLPTYIIHIKPQWYMTSEGYGTCTSGWLIPNDLGVDYTTILNDQWPKLVWWSQLLNTHGDEIESPRFMKILKL